MQSEELHGRVNELEDENVDLKTKLKHAIYSKEKNGYDHFLRGLEKVTSSSSVAKIVQSDANKKSEIRDMSIIERKKSNEAYEDYMKGRSCQENRPQLFSPDTTFDLNLSVRSSSRPPLDRISPNILNTVRAKYNNKLLKSMESKNFNR